MDLTTRKLHAYIQELATATERRITAEAERDMLRERIQQLEANLATAATDEGVPETDA